MKIKGFKKFLQKVPDYRGKRILVVPLGFGLSFLLSLGSMVFLDISPRLFSSVEFLKVLEPLMPIVSTLVFEALGIFIISRIWTKKESYLKEYGELAYQKAFVFIFTGIPIFVASMLHGFVPIAFIPPQPLEGSITWYMAAPLSDFLLNRSDPILIFRTILGSIILLLGVSTVLRSLDTFGLDYMSIMYVYYPEESEIQDHEIYSILRHPTYHGLILMSISAIFFRFSIYSVIICLLFVLGMNVHLKFVEEKELIQRFGDSYREYMNNTNALFYNPKQIGKFFKFLLGIGK